MRLSRRLEEADPAAVQLFNCSAARLVYGWASRLVVLVLDLLLVLVPAHFQTSFAARDLDFIVK